MMQHDLNGSNSLLTTAELHHQGNREGTGQITFISDILISKLL